MAAYLPQSRKSLSHISGVGAAKLERWGEAFLEVIRSYAVEQGLAERPVRAHGAAESCKVVR